jgi:hypothetical protein
MLETADDMRLLRARSRTILRLLFGCGVFSYSTSSRMNHSFHLKDWYMRIYFCSSVQLMYMPKFPGPLSFTVGFLFCKEQGDVRLLTA